MCLLRLDSMRGCPIDDRCVEKAVKTDKIQIGVILAPANDVLNVLDTVATIHPAVQVCFHGFEHFRNYSCFYSGHSESISCKRILHFA